MLRFGGEYYHLDPNNQEDEPDKKLTYEQKKEALERDMTVWMQMDETVVEESAVELSTRFSEFGDFKIEKDTQSSFYMEFFFLEESAVPEQSIE